MRDLETTKIHLKGWGYDTSMIPPEPENLVEIPKFKSSSDELSPQAFFSIEEVDFGDVSSGETVSRVFILFNNSVSSTFKFEFEKPRFVWWARLDPAKTPLRPLRRAAVLARWSRSKSK